MSSVQDKTFVEAAIALHVERTGCDAEALRKLYDGPRGAVDRTIRNDINAIAAIIRQHVSGAGRLAPFLEYLARYDDKAKEWGADKTEHEWLVKLQDEVDEARGVLFGTHDDSMRHELLQIATIAFHFVERFHSNSSPTAESSRGDK